jgi:diacylglycerol kinase family enzyme
VRALLIANPYATSTTAVRREVITRALASELDLNVVQTRYRGHARHVAEGAARDGYELVLTLGGDGTVNEVVNGMLRACPPPAAAQPAATPPAAAQPAETPPAPAQPAATPPAAAQPAATPPAAAQPAATAPGATQPGATPPGAPIFVPLPGGSANVFARALGLPADLVDATGQILGALQERRIRSIGLGLAGQRYFCANAGLGLDAEVVRVVEGLRARGRGASSAMYVLAAVRQFCAVTNRRVPALSLERDGAPALNGLFLGIVSNSSPWTYLGQRPVLASPRADFETGLDLLAVRTLGTLRTLNLVRQMLNRGSGPSGRHVVSLHDQPLLTFRATRPVAFQVDGEYVGEREQVELRSIPNALRVLV